MCVGRVVRMSSMVEDLLRTCFIGFGGWNELNVWLFRDNYLSFTSQQDWIIFLSSLWAFDLGTFRGFLCLIYVEIGELLFFW